MGAWGIGALCGARRRGAERAVRGDIRAGAGDSDPQELTSVNGVLYFTADDGVSGRELWKSDPKTGQTRLVMDIIPGSASSSPSGLTMIGGLLMFAATDASKGRELWVHLPRTGFTGLIEDINPGAGSSGPELLTVVSGFTLFFTADDGVRGRELWFLHAEVHHT